MFQVKEAKTKRCCVSSIFKGKETNTGIRNKIFRLI